MKKRITSKPPGMFKELAQFIRDGGLLAPEHNHQVYYNVFSANDRVDGVLFVELERSSFDRPAEVQAWVRTRFGIGTIRRPKPVNAVFTNYWFAWAYFRALCDITFAVERGDA
jgi:hypothetical protein